MKGPRRRHVYALLHGAANRANVHWPPHNVGVPREVVGRPDLGNRARKILRVRPHQHLVQQSPVRHIRGTRPPRWHRLLPLPLTQLCRVTRVFDVSSSAGRHGQGDRCHGRWRPARRGRGTSNCSTGPGTPCRLAGHGTASGPRRTRSIPDTRAFDVARALRRGARTTLAPCRRRPRKQRRRGRISTGCATGGQLGRLARRRPGASRLVILTGHVTRATVTDPPWWRCGKSGRQPRQWRCSRMGPRLGPLSRGKPARHGNTPKHGRPRGLDG